MRPYLPFQRSQERRNAHPTRRWTGATLRCSPPGLPADHNDGTTSQNADCCSSSMTIIPETRLKVNTNRLKTVALGCIFRTPAPFRRATASPAMGSQKRGPGGVVTVDSDIRGHGPARVPRPRSLAGQDVRMTSRCCVLGNDTRDTTRGAGARHTCRPHRLSKRRSAQSLPLGRPRLLGLARCGYGANIS